jgi:c-di-GMP-binding flagellar brake protein YcgR
VPEGSAGEIPVYAGHGSFHGRRHEGVKMTEENASHEDLMSIYDLRKSGRPFFFPVGLPIQIEINGVSIKMSSVSVGYLADNCLIIKYPSTGTFGSIASKLFKGNKVTVRYTSDGDVLGFQSELLGTINEPVRLLFIAYPTLIARRSLRSSKRVECYLPADLNIDRAKSGDVVRDGIITDISGTGCNLNMVKESPDRVLPDVRVNDAVILHLQLPGMENRIELSGNIRNIQRDSQKIRMGIQFNDIDEERKIIITEYISTLEKFSWEK